MSVDIAVPSKRKKASYFCEICKVACLTSDGLRFHSKDERHIKTEEVDSAQRYGLNYYICLQDYISSPLRSEPLIGLQFVIQLSHDVGRQDSFHCSLCSLTGHLNFIIPHIESFKHRRNYLSLSYKHLFPLHKKQSSFCERNWAVREHAIKVEQEEKSLNADEIKSCTSRIIGVKSDFRKYNIKRLEEYDKKLSAYETQKQNILQHMETLVISSPEEAALVQNLVEELEAAVDVFNLSLKPRPWKSSKRERAQSIEDCEQRYSRHSDHRNKKRSIWYEKEQNPSNSSFCKAEKHSISESSARKEDRIRKISRSVSKDMLLRVTFSTGSGNEAKAANLQPEQQESSTACPVKVSSGNLSEDTEVLCHKPVVNNDIFQDIRAKRNKKYSTDVAKWESLFANNRPEMSRSVFSSDPKSPLLNTDVSSSVEKKRNTRRASLDALSTFTLFSQEGLECRSASWWSGAESFLLPRSPDFKGTMPQDKDPQHEFKQEGNKDQELSCSSEAVDKEAGTTDNLLMHTDLEQQDDKCKPIPNCYRNSEPQISCDQLSDVTASVDQAPKFSHVLNASSEYSDFKACGSKHLDSKTDGQDVGSNVFSNTLTSGKLHASGRQLSSEVLQLFKGKDTNSIVHILKTLSPFYPALQELDLEVFAKGLSETGAITE